jgi:hypothetical protein
MQQSYSKPSHYKPLLILIYRDVFASVRLEQ